jgi:hypothetical protein
MANDEGAAAYALEYDGDYLREMRSLDVEGHILLRRVYSQRGVRLAHVDEWGRPTTEEDGWNSTELREFDENGFVREERYFGLDGKPARSDLGAYAARFERDERGQILRRCSFDEAGRAMKDRFGVHCVSSGFDAFGNTITTEYSGLDGKPEPNLIGVLGGRWETDTFGNALLTTWLGVDGRPWRTSDFPGRCTKIRSHIVDGVLVGADCLNERDEAAPFRPGHASWRRTVDKSGRLMETRWFGPSGTPMAVPSAARVAFSYDGLSFVKEKRFYLPDGSPGQRQGPAIIRLERGEHGLAKSERYFDAHERPTTHRGCAGRNQETNRFRQVTSIACVDGEGKPAKDDDGVSVRQFHYLPNGFLGESAYFGTNGRPIENEAGYARVVTVYDSQGGEAQELYFDVSGNPVPLPRFRVLRVRPPYVNGDWVYGEREQALARIEEARKRLLAGTDFGTVALQFGDEEGSAKDPGKSLYLDPKRVYSAVRLAIEGLKVGEVSSRVEIPAGLFLYQRIQ